jgi:hypothetical protein
VANKDPLVGDLFPAVHALGVEAPEDVDAVRRSLGDIRGGHTPALSHTDTGAGRRL